MTTGEKIKNARKKAGLTQKALAQKTGLATGTIQQYEYGDYKPKIEQLRKIAAALGVYISDLVNDWNEIPYEELEKDWINNPIEPEELTVLVKKGRKDTINNLLDLMNDEGQKKAVDQVELLTKIPEYQKDPFQD